MPCTDFDRSVLHARQLLREGRDIPPSLVADEVQRSWSRSLGYGLSERDRVLFNPVSAAQLRRIDEEHRLLLGHAEPEMHRLFDALDNAHWVVACLEAHGCVIKSMGGGGDGLRDIATVLRPGINLSENVAGTSAPGCVLKEQRPVVVRGGEHFLEEAHRYACVAVPIFYPSGRLAGALNASRHHDNQFIGILEPLALAARAIENSMLDALPGALRIRLHYSAELVDSPMCGVLALSHDGELLGANPLARQLLELDILPEAQHTSDGLFQCPLGPLLDRLRAGQGGHSGHGGSTPTALRCYNGLRVYASLAPDAQRRAAIRAQAAAPRATAKTDAPTMLADAALHQRVQQAERAFARDIPVLINGETGTGKELLARHLHDTGPRAAGPFVAINCSAIPAGLIESELFGYDNGAFTGARRGGMPGRFEQAHGGTLFLDEIGDMPLELQARLLRVLQERTLTRLGSARSVALDCSVVCATHRDLTQRVAAGEFREDLYYRIHGLRITLPPLRERGDLDTLIDHLLRHEAGAGPLPVPTPTLSAEARQCLHRYRWPGNIRELQQVIRLGVALADTGRIDLTHLPAELTHAAGILPAIAAAQAHGASPDAAADATTLRPPGTLQHTEGEAIRTAFVRHGGNVSATARALGIARATLYRKLRQHGLADDDDGAPAALAPAGRGH